jgi:hypothetical protein
MGFPCRDCPGAPDPSPAAASAAREALRRPPGPPGQPPLTVELTLHPSDRDYTDIAQPEAGEVRGFLYDPRSGKLQFNLEDDRNNLNIMLSEADAMAAELEREFGGDY